MEKCKSDFIFILTKELTFLLFVCFFKLLWMKETNHQFITLFNHLNQKIVLIFIQAFIFILIFSLYCDLYMLYFGTFGAPYTRPYAPDHVKAREGFGK